MISFGFLGREYITQSQKIFDCTLANTDTSFYENGVFYPGCDVKLLSRCFLFYWHLIVKLFLAEKKGSNTQFKAKYLVSVLFLIISWIKHFLLPNKTGSMFCPSKLQPADDSYRQMKDSLTVIFTVTVKCLNKFSSIL